MLDYEVMANRTTKRKALGYGLLATALTVAVVVLTPIGSLFVYGWLVPVIGPVIPKPEGVPSRASAAYHWKGFGLVWSWDEPVKGGCAQWWAAEDHNDVVLGLTVFEGAAPCEDGERAMNRYSFEDHTTFGSGENPSSDSRECSFDLNGATIGRYRKQIDDLIATSSSKIAMDMLQSTRSELDQIDRVGLQAEQYGCSVRKS